CRCMCCRLRLRLSFHAAAPTEIYTLSLHDALPISVGGRASRADAAAAAGDAALRHDDSRGQERLRPHDRGRAEDAPRDPSPERGDRKSTRLNSSHVKISYAVFCLKKKTIEEENAE